MLTVAANDINEAFPVGMMMLDNNGVLRESRNGSVIELDEPVATTYKNPTQRVLFCPERDANPFFHFMEGLWMLSGRNDVAWISEYNSKIHEYSDNGETFHGAYGYRLRRLGKNGNPVLTPEWDIDQLRIIPEMLRNDPTDRRAVAQVWNAGMDLNKASKDLPCNDMIFFKVRDNALHMTVCCRSNDAIWGAYGSNAVHFSMIQEYVASMAGYKVGRYVQISDSLHAYVNNPQREALKGIYYRTTDFDPYLGAMDPYPMFEAGMPVCSWDIDLKFFMNEKTDCFIHSFFSEVAVPMRTVWRTHKAGNTQEAHKLCDTIRADDWRRACKEWLERRMK